MHPKDLGRGIGGVGIDQLGPDVAPVVGAQVFAGDLATGLALDTHADDNFQKLPDGNRLAQVTHRGSTALRERRLLSHGQAIQVFQKESHVCDYTRR